MKRWICGLIWVCSGFASANSPQQVLQQLRLPAGFTIRLFADNVPNARGLALGKSGVVFVGTRQGEVYALQDQNGDGEADQRYTLAKGQNLPTGVAYKDGDLYVAEISRIVRLPNIEQHLTNPPALQVVYDQLPTDRHHGWKYLRVGPDGRLYTAVGAPCNNCKSDQDIYASLISLNTDGSGLQILARGVRNSVGFDWYPDTGDLWFNDNGRDYLGDDAPADELNQLQTTVSHFGFPYCHAGTIADPQFGAERQCQNTIAPAWRYPAHVAPLGMRFYLGTQFPSEYRNQLLVAQHGSWNRTQPQGYQISLIKFKNGKPDSEQPFIHGWLTKKGKVLGRPVDLLQRLDGSLLISDDHLGVIYLVKYSS